MERRVQGLKGSDDCFRVHRLFLFLDWGSDSGGLTASLEVYGLGLAPGWRAEDCGLRVKGLNLGALAKTQNLPDLWLVDPKPPSTEP